MVGFELLEWAARGIVILLALTVIVTVGLRVWMVVHRMLRLEKMDDDLFKKD